VASRVTRATFLRLCASRRSANPSIGVGRDEGEKERKKNPDAKRAGSTETGLFDIVNMKDA
jgi:hypothetical protein